MSISHLDKLRYLLEKSHWMINEEFNDLNEHDLEWHISRPNGDCPLVLEFCHGGSGPYGEYTDAGAIIEKSIGCDIHDHKEIEKLYFSKKYHGHFQRGVTRFVEEINRIDAKS